MTLLTTEIIADPQPGIVFAADRRISRGGRRLSERRKIMRVPGWRAGIGYFGLAETPLAGPRRYMDVWLADFLRANAGLGTLGDLAAKLAADLNQIIPVAVRARQLSGFHLAGLNALGQPEFWFVRNIADDRITIVGQYSAREDFQARDRANLPPGAIRAYRNGDIRAHAAVWEEIDKTFGQLLGLPEFQLGTGPRARMKWAKFKLETIAHFYQRFCRVSIIAKPVDALAIASSGVYTE